MWRSIKVISLLIVSCLLLSGCGEETFLLEEKYYRNNQVNEIDESGFQTLIEDKESFAMFIYQPLCAASDAFEVVLKEFINRYQISFYKMSFTNMKETSLGEKIKYYPSLVIYQDGKLVDYLDANSEDDKEYYQDIEGFTEWFLDYVTINEDELYNEDMDDNEENVNQVNGKIDAKLENVKYDENKVNIYFFWGNGCPHCEAEHEFFKEIEKEYGKYYNLNTFEVWYNEDNLEILKQFTMKMGDELGGVPYTIVGNKTFSGFGEKAKKQIKEAIMSQYKNSYDVYFDTNE